MAGRGTEVCLRSSRLLLCVIVSLCVISVKSTVTEWTAHYTVEGRLVERFYNSSGHLHQCHVYGDRYLSENALQLVPRSNQFLVDERKFQRLVDECTDIDLSGDKHRRKKRVVQLIFPGTKWCGTGNVANGFDDVGRRHNTDICCRRHDHCPIYIRPGETKYNLTNNAIGSISSCACDQEFHDCLKATDTPIARSVGELFFNGLRLPCIEESHPEQCSGWWLWKTCRKVKTEPKKLNIVQSAFTF